MDDFALLSAWQGGDAGSGEALFKRHFDAIRRFMRNKLPAEDVEDAVQKTFLDCVESRDRFRGDASFRTFLFSIARHELYRVIRKRATDPVARGLDFTGTSLLDLGISPSVAFAKDEDQRLVVRALQQLPVDDQIVLELHYWEDQGAAEIATVFDVAPATARVRLFRARQRLKELVDKVHAGKLSLERVEQTARVMAGGSR